jgi:hypothetical protein
MIYLYQNELKEMVFILCFITQYYHYKFAVQILQLCLQGAFFKIAPGHFGMLDLFITSFSVVV